MLISCDRLSLHIRIPPAPVDLLPVLPGRLVTPDPLARHHVQRGRPDRVAKESDAVPRLVGRLPGHGARTAAAVPLGEDHAVHGAPQQPVRPVTQQVANVDQDGGRRVVFGARWADGDGRPGVVPGRVDLEAGLAPEAEEEGDAAVVGVGARADVLRGGGQATVIAIAGACAGAGEAGQGRVVQEAEDVAC